MRDDWQEQIDAGVCPLCSGDCGSANPPVYDCPMQKLTVDTGDDLHKILGEALARAGL
jgi:hypothetical protein